LPVWRYTAVVLVIAAFALLAPIPSGSVRQAALSAARSSESIAILGPSVIRHTSVCDSDQSNLAEMLADASDRSVIDLSYPGQPLLKAAYLAAFEASYGRSTDIVLTMTYDSLDDWPTLPYRELIFFQLANPSFAAAIDLRTPDTWQGLLGRPTPLDLGFEYEGTAYPDQRGIHAKWFEAEKAQSTCPETTTHDWQYLKAYTWFRWVQPDPDPAAVPIITNLDSYLRAKGKTLHVVMLPVNYKLLADFDRNWATTIRDRQWRKFQELRQRGLSVLDLSNLLSANEFSTVWCACTHFNEVGRRRVADAISKFLSLPLDVDDTDVAMETSADLSARRPD
jgi:hypothetical protein